VEVDPLKIVLVDLTTRATLTSAVGFIFSRILNIAQKDDKKFLAIPACGFNFASFFVVTRGWVGGQVNKCNMVRGCSFGVRLEGR
jgi:hypothetical protein